MKAGRRSLAGTGAPARLLCCLALILALLVSNAVAKKLSPQCDGKELTGTVTAGHSSTITKLSGSGTTLTLRCFAHEVISTRGGQADKDKDYCGIDHQTEYDYQLFIQAKYEDEDGNGHTQNFNVRDLAGGSIDSVTIRTNYPSRFSLKIVNKATDSRCTLSLRALMTYDISGTSTSKESSGIPTLAAIVPRTIYVGREQTTMVLQYPNDGSERKIKDDALFLCPLKEKCESAETRLSMDVTKLPPSFHPHDEGALYGSHARRFSGPGSYRVCYRSKDRSLAVPLAMVTVFDSNPAYFDIVQGLGPSGELHTGELIVIKFFGHDLDTRPGGDSAKMVLEEADCNGGAPAGGVPEATDLGPADNFGPSTTFSLWKLIIREGGVYKVCYRRAGTNQYTTVPFISTVDPGNGGGAGTTLEPVPVPKDESGNVCPMATSPGDGEAWVKYQSVKLVMEKKKSTEEVLKTFGDLFCVPRSAFAIVRVTRNAAQEQVVYFSFLCDNVTRQDGTKVCDNTERFNYAAGLGTGNEKLLRQYGVKSVASSTSIATAADDPNADGGGGGALSTLIICSTVLAVAALLAFTVVKYREKRQYMVQFGMDDADLDDMYAVGGGPLPSLDVSGGATGARGASQDASIPRVPTVGRTAPIRDAVIEIED